LTEYTITEHLNDLETISATARFDVGRAVIGFLESQGIPDPTKEQVKEAYLAALDAIADLIQYGKLGPAAIGRLHRAREFCGIPLEQSPA